MRFGHEYKLSVRYNPYTAYATMFCATRIVAKHGREYVHDYLQTRSKKLLVKINTTSQVKN